MSRLNCYDFGRQLIDAGDLDPVYTAVWHAGLEGWELKRWLPAYWAFYHCGTASWITEGDTGYWDRFAAAAGSKEYPRASERRHYRGAAALRSAEYLRGRGLGPLFAPLYAGGTAAAVMAEVRTWTGFGPWIAFKAADMLDRLGIAPVTFSQKDTLYESPLASARLLAEQEGYAGGDHGAWAMGRVLKELGPIPAPPRFERPMGYQEAETVLCKYKSYLGGHYHIGEDVAALRAGLLRFARVRMCQRLLRGGKAGGLWR